MVKGKPATETKITLNQSPQTAPSASNDTKTLLSDHIKKHVRAVRNTVNNNPSQTSSKNEKTVSKSCSKADEMGQFPS